MADYIAQTRSNYFKVKDEERFQMFCQRYGLELITPSASEKQQARFGFMIYASLPSGRADDKGEWIETDFVQELSAQLVPGEVAVVMEIGSEKMRFLNGCAIAVNSQGKQVEVGLNEIYHRAKARFGVMPTSAEY